MSKTEKLFLDALAEAEEKEYQRASHRQQEWSQELKETQRLLDAPGGTIAWRGMSWKTDSAWQTREVLRQLAYFDSKWKPDADLDAPPSKILRYGKTKREAVESSISDVLRRSRKMKGA